MPSTWEPKPKKNKKPTKRESLAGDGAQYDIGCTYAVLALLSLPASLVAGFGLWLFHVL